MCTFDRAAGSISAAGTVQNADQAYLSQPH